MSKLDNIILQCANKVLDGKEEKLGDYIDPTKEQIKDLILELVNDEKLDPTQVHVNDYPSWWDAVNGRLYTLRKKIEEL